MRALRLEAPGNLAPVQIPHPGQPGPGEALVRIMRVGICGTDLHAFGGRQPFFTYPRILGHELGVEIISAGPGVSLRAGQRCSVEPYMNCERCHACRTGKPNCCANLRVLGVHMDGGMCEEIILPARKLHPSDRLTFEQLALVETLGIGCHAVARSGVAKGEAVLVIGAGPVGMAVMQFAAEAGAEVAALDVNVGRLEFCRKHVGVSRTVDASGSAMEGISRAWGGELPSVVLDATGNPKSMADSFNFPAQGGRLVFVGLFPGEVTFSDPNFHRRELSLLASRNSLPSDFDRIIGLIEAGRIDTTPWITHRSNLAEACEAFPGWTRADSGVIKAMVTV